MSTFRRNFLFSALKPLLRDSTHLYRKGKTSAVGAMERKATTHVGSWLSLSCVPSPAKQVGTSRFRAEAMGNENSAPPAAGAWPDLQHKKRNATAELGRDRPGTETLGPLLKRKIKTAADQAASMLMPPPSSKCLYKHKATRQLGGDLLMNMAETAAPLLKWMQNEANEAAVRTMVPAPSSKNLYKHEAMGQLGGDLLMNLDETSVPLLKWIKNDPDEAAVKTMVPPPSSENLLKHKATGQLGGTLFSKQTETANPSLVKRIATAADEASAEAATKLLSAPPSGCLYKLKSKDQPGRNHPRVRKLPKSISKDLNAGRRGKISLVMESEGLTVEGRSHDGEEEEPTTAASSTSGAPAKPLRFFRRALQRSSPSRRRRPAKFGGQAWRLDSSDPKRDEKRSRSLGLISSDDGNVIFPAVEEAKASPAKRSIGGFADEDDLLDWDEGFVEPPSKLNRSAAGRCLPKLQLLKRLCGSSFDCLFPLQGEGCSCRHHAPPSISVISSLEAFASQFTSLEADKVRLQEEVKSSSSKLDGAIKKAAMARQEVDSLKEELGKLKERLKEEEARAAEKDELLRQSSLALLEAANIPAAALDKVPNNSPANGVSMALASHQLTRELLEKGKGALARMHLMIFPKIKQDKTLGQLIDAFAVDTKEVIEVFPVPSFVDDSSGALPEGDRIQRMKDRITQMEKDLRSTYALAAIVSKKSEIAADVERFALTELHKATESLNCKFLDPDALLSTTPCLIL
ncbi:hypothetical protein QYE76_000044 [Lolium multiflorum]|uniref:Uncharacterized protein n=1 Tax=Lolium multiflorum TaxID=4521 RepID=A0AAD8QKG6_LOLMU|nr:hypothetical protein QYE76_000044 [Lolium multiflorum]